ncbi:MAG TPA: hypothetical protein GX497_10895 [Bacillus bacterium]|nr:hypothetical protein [Bacillus sp. (in: firmicutes)]
MFVEIKLESDLCTASGESVPGVIDIDIATDELGFPIIPARRIKGCLKEAALEIRDALQEDFNEIAFALLFGISGEQEGSLKVDNGVLQNYEVLRKEVENLKSDKRYQTFYQKENITDYYTYVRSQTSINKNTGAALKDSLRSLRVIKKGQVFHIPIELETDDQEVILLLKNCCKALRHIGLNRTRGLGEVSCELKEELALKQFSHPIHVHASDDNLCQLTYQLTLQTQLILSQQIHSASQTDTYLSGSALLGVFATEYIKQHRLENDAHYNEEFYRLFLSDHVKFLNAYPYDGEIVYYPTPLSFVQKKDKTECYDLAFNEDQQTVEEEKIQTKKLSGYVAFTVGGFQKYVPEVEIEYHHQRPKNRMIGHATKDEGAFFQYVVLKKGQSFCGSIIGEKHDLERLALLMENKDTIRIGRSKTAQYAKVNIQLDSISDYETTFFDYDERCVITLASPCIVRNPNTGMIEANPTHLINEIHDKYPMLSTKQYFVSTTEIGGFNGKWGLPKIQCQALAAGSVFVFEIKECEVDIDFEQLEKDSYGLRSNEGFGRILVNQHGFNSIYYRPEIEQKDERSLAKPIHTQLLLTAIQKRKMHEQVIERALNAANVSLHNSLISKLIGMLDAANSIEKFEEDTYYKKQKILSESKRKKLQPFWDFYKKNQFAEEKKQISIYSKDYRLLTEESKAYVDSWELAKLYYKTIFLQMKFMNREIEKKKQVVKNEQ